MACRFGWGGLFQRLPQSHNMFNDRTMTIGL